MEVLDPVVRILGEVGVSVSPQSRDSLSVLHRAAILGNVKEYSDTKTVSDLVNHRDGHGFTPLHYSILVGDLEGIDALLKLGADVNALSSSVQSPSRLGKQTEIDSQEVESLSGYSPLHLACRTYRPDIVSLLLTVEHVNVNLKSDPGVGDSRRDAVTALHVACKYLFIEAAEMLIVSRKANVNVTSGVSKMTPLHVIAINSGPWTKSKLKEFEINTFPSSAAEHVRLLLDNRAVVNAEDKNGATPLHLAAMVGAVGVMEVLAAAKEISLNAKDKDGLSPLHYASAHGVLASGSSSPVSFLLKKGANVLCETNDGKSALDILISLKGKRIWNESCDLAIQIAERLLSHSLQAAKKSNEAAAMLEQEESDRY